MSLSTTSPTNHCRTSRRSSDPQVSYILSAYLSYCFASIIGQWLKRKNGADNATIANLNARIYAWWLMTLVLLGAFWFGKIGTVVPVFPDFICRTARVYDPRSIAAAATITAWWSAFTCCCRCNTISFMTVGTACSAFLFRFTAFDTADYCQSQRPNRAFLERAAKTQWMAMICIFCLSHVPALMFLDLDGFDNGNNILLLIFLIGVVQVSDVLQYVWGKLIGGAKSCLRFPPSKTISGTVGGILSATAIAALMAPITPFSHSQAAVIGFIVCLMGFFGGLVMSAIKRDYGVKDWGNMIRGHGGML